MRKQFVAPMFTVLVLALACASPTPPQRADADAAPAAPVVAPSGEITEMAPSVPSAPTTPAETLPLGEPSPHRLRAVPDRFEGFAPTAPVAPREAAPRDGMPLLEPSATEPMPHVTAIGTEPMPVIGGPAIGAPRKSDPLEPSPDNRALQP